MERKDKTSLCEFYRTLLEYKHTKVTQIDLKVIVYEQYIFLLNVM